MVLTKIYFARKAIYQPGNKASSRLIRKELRDYINFLPSFNYTKDKFSFIRVLTKYFKCTYELQRPQKKNCSGLLNLETRHITIKKYSLLRIKRILCHEIAHTIQFDLKLWNSKYFSEELRMEQEAESMAVLLFKKFFPKDKLLVHKFEGYFKEADIIFLLDYYKNIYINDLVKWRKK